MLAENEIYMEAKNEQIKLESKNWMASSRKQLSSSVKLK